MAFRSFSRKLIVTFETAAIFGALILFPLTAWGQDSASAEVPAELVPPEGAKLVLQALAKGDQIYACKEQNGQYSWTLKAPEAQLFDRDGKVIGRHIPGPTWELNDKSTVTGKMIARADSPDKNAIPWLLLEAVGHSGNGLLSKATHIQRLNTKGGKAPSLCDPAHAGEEIRVPYSATYLFYEAQQDLSQKAEKIQALLYTGKFAEAESLARECVGQAPEEIYFLSQLDMALNGQGKFHDADELRDRIRKLWERKYKEKWIAKGAPVSESSWARVIATGKNYYVIGAEYFVPRLLEGKKDDQLALHAFYKVIAVPKEGGGRGRILQLDNSREERNYFLEEYSAGSVILATTYGANKPDIRAVVSDTVVYLDGHP